MAEKARLIGRVTGQHLVYRRGMVKTSRWACSFIERISVALSRCSGHHRHVSLIYVPAILVLWV